MPHALAAQSVSFKASLPASEHADFDAALAAHDAPNQGKIIDFFNKLVALLGNVINYKCLFSLTVILAIVAGNFSGALAAYVACAGIPIPPTPQPTP